MSHALAPGLTMTMTMTMTHSDEVTNRSQKPGPTDMSAGVMTPHKGNLISLYALLSRQGRLLVLCLRQCTESRVKKKRPTGICCDRFVRVQRGNVADTRVFQDKRCNIVEDEVDGQEEGQDDKREDGQQREESGVVEESQNKHMSAWS